MSVPKRERTESKFEVMLHAIKLRREITLLLLRDFGIKSKIRNFRCLAEFSEEDRVIYEGLSEKYDFKHTLVDVYPEWLINHFRESIMRILYDLIKNITFANSIYITNEAEHTERRKYQTNAISDCEHLLQELQYIISLICANTDLNRYTRYTDMVNRQIALLRSWRKSDNKHKKQQG